MLVDIFIDDRKGNTKSLLKKLADDRKIDVTVNIDEESEMWVAW